MSSFQHMVRGNHRRFADALVDARSLLISVVLSGIGLRCCVRTGDTQRICNGESGPWTVKVWEPLV